MNTQANTVPQSAQDSQAATPPAMSTTRPMYWSVRRELWENRSIHIAPLAVAALAMLGFLVSLVDLPQSVRELAALDPAKQRATLAQPYSHVGWLLALTAVLVGVFYCLDALHGERRDRSILFWKSLPVSDLTTVLSKATIAFVVLPLIAFAIAVPLQWIMLLLSNLVLVLSGEGAPSSWGQWPLIQLQLALLYGLVVMTLWYAPIYGWLMLVSGWARRATFLWAVLPPLAIVVAERIAFHSWYIGSFLKDRNVESFLKDRLIGFAGDAFDLQPQGGVPVDAHFIALTQLTPGRFLSTPGLWIGLGFAAIFLAAAVRLRRHREPV